MKVLLGTFNKENDLPGAFFAIVELPTSARLVCSSNQHMCLVIYKLIDMFWCKHSVGTLQLLHHWGSIRDDQWSRFSVVKLPSHFLPPLPHLHCTHWNIIKLLNVNSRAVLNTNALVGSFNQEKALLVGALTKIVKTDRSFAALFILSSSFKPF